MKKLMRNDMNAERSFILGVQPFLGTKLTPSPPQRESPTGLFRANPSAHFDRFHTEADLIQFR